MKRAISLAAVAALLAAAVGAYAALGAGEPKAPSATTSAQRPVRVSGHVDGLYPGARVILRARARNRTAQPLRLLWVKARVRDASGDCPRTALRTRRSRPRAVIAPGKRRRLRIRVRMSPEAPDGCQGATFPLRYRSAVARLRR